jgi:hypothetical protein
MCAHNKAGVPTSSVVSSGSASCAWRACNAALLPLVLDWAEVAARGVGRSGGQRQRMHTRGRALGQAAIEAC